MSRWLSVALALLLIGAGGAQAAQVGDETSSAGSETAVVVAVEESAPPIAAPVGPSATCADGTASYSAHASGTCSHHGGVQTWGPNAPPDHRPATGSTGTGTRGGGCGSRGGSGVRSASGHCR